MSFSRPFLARQVWTEPSFGRTRRRAELLLLAGVLAACRSPTEISVAITTDFACTDLRHTTITVGPPGADLEGKPPTATATTCKDGYVGSVVVVPSAGDTAEVGIKVVSGFGTKYAEDCAPGAASPPDYGPSCIVARRALRYIPHSRLRVPIVMRAACRGIACGATETCDKGACVPAAISDPAACGAPNGCGEGSLGNPGDAGTLGPPVEAGAPSLSASCGDMRGLQAGAPWPMSGYCPTRASRSPYVGARSATIKWLFPAPPATDAVVAADGTVYYGASDGKLYAVTPTGAQKWAFSTTTSTAVTGAPAIGTDGTVYFGAGDNNLYAVTPAGQMKWKYACASYVSAATIGGDGTVYFCSSEAVVHAVDSLGNKRWEAAVGGSEMRNSQPVLSPDGATIYVADFDGSVYALSAATGVLKWHFDSAGIAITPAVGADGTIYFGSADFYLYAVTPAGKKKWAYKTGAAVYAAPAIGPTGILYAPSDNGVLYAVDPQGSSPWSFSTGRAATNCPTVGADGAIYVMASDGVGGDVFALDAQGHMTWSANNNALVSPAIAADGTLYAGNAAFGP